MRKALGHARKKKQAYGIRASNEVRLVARQAQTSAGNIIFSTERELSLRTANWPGSRLVEIWNNLPRVKPLKKFTNRRIAIHRIWQAVQEGTVKQAKGASKQIITLESPRRPNTKAAQIIALLTQPSGATLRSIMELTGWKAHSIRGFISAQLSKKRGLHIKSYTRDGERVYSVSSK
jgi:hypothetical protein